MITKAALCGYLLEEALAWMLRGAGYRLLVDVSQDPHELAINGNGLCVKGRGAEHQVDVLGEFVFTPAFSLPIRLFLEAKFTKQKSDLVVVRNAHGVIHDINENFVHAPGARLRKRYRYVYALFSVSGFTAAAQDFALAQQISLVDLSGASFAWLRRSVESAAENLRVLAQHDRVNKFPVIWMRRRLRAELGTMPDLSNERKYQTVHPAGFAVAAGAVLDDLVGTLKERRHNELLLGFPAAPFVLPMATDNVERFLAYAREYPDHAIRLVRTRGGDGVEWEVSPIGQEWMWEFSASPNTYRLTFNLPERLGDWICENEEYGVGRIRAFEGKSLPGIIVYRVEGNELQIFQLRYRPEDVHQGHRQQKR
ncbi:hypothetical protein [Spongiactinospora sp. 9N601]|uniref:hypothetical protein n=1 Tax=Spongiactinospora sp. 9N601 TaxID=3375149 RepID=UPI0037B56E48